MGGPLNKLSGSRKEIGLDRSGTDQDEHRITATAPVGRSRPDRSGRHAEQPDLNAVEDLVVSDIEFLHECLRFSDRVYFRPHSFSSAHWLGGDRET
ncbi:hypothetical protein SDC9_152065 [bioreactor metagenome]|uniref:Uncharacterized protein n=1 Tax=bioreactor metagenome TaxID=1076179 RepID=A0A645ESL1_9ZZZZ